jgi:hypothetical protein
VILSLPICISAYLPRDPAIISLGPIMSSNRMLPFCPCERSPSTQARLLESRIDLDLPRRATKDWQRTAGRDHQDSLRSADLTGRNIRPITDNELTLPTTTSDKLSVDPSKMAKPQISLELSPGMGFRGLVYAPGIPKSVAPAHDATSSTSISLKLGALFDNQGYPTQRQV